jgi:hypothetical protein
LLICKEDAGMARKLLVLATILLAASVGVLGFQIVDYWIDGSWPPVSLHFVWNAMFGPFQNSDWLSLGLVWNALGTVPVVAAGMLIAYGTYLLSDTLRRRG